MTTMKVFDGDGREYQVEAVLGIDLLRRLESLEIRAKAAEARADHCEHAIEQFAKRMDSELQIVAERLGE